MTTVRAFLTIDSYSFLNDFALAKEGAQDGVGGFGRVSRVATDANTARLERVKNAKMTTVSYGIAVVERQAEGGEALVFQ